MSKCFNINNLYKSITRMSSWGKIVLVLIIFLFFSYVLMHANRENLVEGFTQREKFISKEGVDLYDSFYSSIYDELVYDNIKNNYELGELVKTTKMNPKQSMVLDVGSGTGHHVHKLTEMGFNAQGIDVSKEMINKSKSNYPKLAFKQADALDTMIFNPESFTHINCLYFTIYYIKNKMSFFENCFKWLKPGGYLNIHLVNRDNFNPIINAADPLVLVSPQKFAKNRITNSIVKFNNFQYKADFKFLPEKNLSYFEETFKDDKSGNVRKNNHVFYMDTQKEILALAKSCGFILESKIDMVYCKYEYQYVYILYKPE